jgi:hypothetical protein
MALFKRMRDTLRQWPAAAQLRLARLNLLARTHVDAGFAALAADPAWRDALRRPRARQRVLIATNSGGHFAIAAIDRMLGAALTLRGAAATHVLCDKTLPACQMCEYNLTPDLAGFARHGPAALLCGYCHAPAERDLRAIGLEVVRLGDALSTADRAEAKAIAAACDIAKVSELNWRGIAIGEHARAGALRFFARGDLGGERAGEPVLRRFIEAAALSAAAYLELIDRHQPDVLVAHHGIYTPQGLAVAAARARGVRVVTWNPAYRRHCFIFSHDDSYHHTLMDEPTSVWREQPLSPAEHVRIREYLHSRREGGGDWIKYHTAPDYALTADLNRLGIDAARPLIAAFTNVFWDAQLHFPRNAFDSQTAWLEDTITYFSSRADLQLAIRVHPAERSSSPPSRQHASDVIAARFPVLPDNIKVIEPDSAVSSYALAEQANAALIYGTKLGVELSALGVPVIVAGEAWSRGKGFTRDARSRADYRALLSELPLAGRLEAREHDLALRYANHFFFRRMIALPFVHAAPGPHRFRIAIKGADDLAERRWPGLDVICRGILEDTPFLCDTTVETPRAQ